MTIGKGDARQGLVVATALSLYAYNVDVHTRAIALHEHFNGDCMEIEELVRSLAHRGEYFATELPAPTALAYVQQALARYGVEAESRVRVNLGMGGS
jgi:hypothetical protein